MAVTSICAGCGFEAPPDFAFCPRCGARLAASAPAPPPPPVPERAPEADRRVASVLFADLSGFTTLSERLDPEDVRALQSDLIHELTSVIEKYHGFIEKYVGDAVLAAFGAPVAHEDDAERALNAALEMCERVAQLSRRWEPRLGEPLTLHVGVNTGPVVAGMVGSGAAAAYAVTGDTVNTASRLQALAGRGEIVVSEQTFRLTAHAFEFSAPADVTLKGRSEPVTVYRVLRPVSGARGGRGLGAYGLATPLVARDDELALLHELFARMQASCAQIVSVSGEAGAGKSRLVAEFLARLDRGGELRKCAVRRAVCVATREQPYGVIAALLREAYAVSDDDTLATAREKLTVGLQALGTDASETRHLADLLGYMLGLTLEDPAVRHLEPDQLKRQLFIAARTAIERRLWHNALLFIVEDLHWADAASIEMLGYIMEHVGQQRLMLLVTQRATDFAGLDVGTTEHTRIQLQPLAAHDCERLLHAWFGDAESGLPERMRHDIIARCGGNPFFLEELLRAFIQRGVLVRGDQGWTHAGDAALSAVPLTLHGLLLSHVDRLPPAVRAVLQGAAVIGPVFELDLLCAMDTHAQPATALPQLVAAELIMPDDAHNDGARAPRNTYRFRHALLQEAVYQNLLLRRRTELHTRVGEALERLHGERPQKLEEIEALGHHWSLSEDRQRGARYLIAAGDWARSIFANEDALRHYERALETLTQCEAGDATLPGVQERLGDVLGLIGRRAEAIAHHEAALGCYWRLRDVYARARQLRKIGELHWAAGDRATAKTALQDALVSLEDGGDLIERANVYQTMGRHAFRSGDNRAAVDWALRALQEAETAGERATAPESQRAAAEAVAHARNTMGVALAQLGRMQEAVEHLERSVALGAQLGLHQAACRGLANLAVLYSTLDPRRAIDTCTRGLETAKKIGDFALQSRLYSNLAVAYCALTNRCDEHGISAAHKAIELDRRLGQLDHLTVPLIVLAQIQQCHGEPDAAFRYYREALALAEQTGEAQLLFPCYDGLATLHLELGEEAEAEQYMVHAQAVCERAGVSAETLVVLPFLD